MVDCPEYGRYDCELPLDLRISLSEVSAECYTNGNTKLSNISFDVKERQILSIVGPQKSGKVCFNFQFTDDGSHWSHRPIFSC